MALLEKKARVVSISSGLNWSPAAPQPRPCWPKISTSSSSRSCWMRARAFLATEVNSLGPCPALVSSSMRCCISCSERNSIMCLTMRWRRSGSAIRPFSSMPMYSLAITFSGRVSPAELAAGGVGRVALELQQPLGDGPALVELADQVLLRNLHVGEEHLRERRLAGDGPDRPHLDARGLHVDQEEADAVMLDLGIGAHEAEAPVGEAAARGPDLLAVDQIVVALVLGLGLQAGEVRTRARLGIALAPAHLAARDPGQVQLLLFLVAVFEQRRAEQRRAHAGHRVEGAAVGVGLQHDPRLRRRQPAAAVVLRPAGRAPALVAHALLPERPIRAVRIARHVLIVFFQLRLQRFREVRLDPGLRLLAECVQPGAYPRRLPVRSCCFSLTGHFWKRFKYET